MKQTILATLCCLFSGAGGAPAAAQATPADAPSHFERIRRAFARSDGTTVLVVAHRGAHKRAPENSLAAIREAGRMGADIVEVDLQKTRDGHFVLMHDPTVDRTTDGHGAVAAMTLERLKTLRLRMTDRTLTDERVPTLEEALDVARDRCLLNLDKVETHLDAVYDVLKRQGALDRVILRSWQPPALVKSRLAKWNPAPAWVPRVTNADAARAFLGQLHPPAVDVIFGSSHLPVISADFVKEMHDAGARVWVTTIFPGECAGLSDQKALEDPDAAWGRLINLGVDVIQTDEPEALLEYLRKRGKHQ